MTAGCAATRRRRGKRLWEFDLNPKDSVWPKTRNEVISTPIILENVVYIANGQDPEHGEGVGHLYAIDAHQARRHHQDRSRSGTTTRSAARFRPARSTTASCSTRTSAASCTRSTRRPASRSGRTTCSPRSGDRRWSSTARSISATRTATSRSSAADKAMKVVAENNMGSSVYSTPVPANGTLYIVNRNQLFALAEDEIDANNSVQIRSFLLRFRNVLLSVFCSLVAQSPRSPPLIAGRSFAAPPRCSVRRMRSCRHAEGAVDVRGRRRDRILGGHRRRRRSTSVLQTGELHAVNLADGEQVEVQGVRRRDRRVVSGGRRRAGLHR